MDGSRFWRWPDEYHFGGFLLLGLRGEVQLRELAPAIVDCGSVPNTGRIVRVGKGAKIFDLTTQRNCCDKSPVSLIVNAAIA